MTASEHGSSPALRAQDTEISLMIKREIADTYTTPELRAAYRAGMSTAAMICDAHAAMRSEDVAPVARDCGNAIWAYRELVEVHEPRGLSAAEPSSNGEGVTS